MAKNNLLDEIETEDDGANREPLEDIIRDIEKLEGQKAIVADKIKDRFRDAKEQDYNVKAIREVLRYRKMDGDTRELLLRSVDDYRQELGL